MRRPPAEHFRKACKGLVSLGSLHSGVPAVTGVETERKEKTKPCSKLIGTSRFCQGWLISLMSLGHCNAIQNPDSGSGGAR